MDGDLVKNESVAIALAEDQARFLKALGNPWRLRILAILLHEPKQVGDLEESLGLAQAYVSQQLARLRAEGIVVGERNGRSVLYRVSDPRVEQVLRALGRHKTA